MGNNVTPDFLRGFIIPMELGSANIWQSETTITQQNPSAGGPSPPTNFQDESFIEWCTK